MEDNFLNHQKQEKEESGKHEHYKHDNHKKSFVGPLIIILIGILFLLSNFGIEIDWDLIWPVILIVIGMAMLVGRGSIGGWIIGVIIIVAILGLAYSFISSDLAEQIGLNWDELISKKIQTTTKEIIIKKDQYPDIVKIDLAVSINTGKFEMISEPNDDFIFWSSAKYNYEHLEPVLNQDKSGNVLDLNYTNRSSNSINIFDISQHIAEYNVKLTQPGTLMDLKLELGSGEMTSTIKNQKLSNFDIVMGSGEMLVTFSGDNPEVAIGKFNLGSGKLIVNGIDNGNFSSLNGEMGSGNLTLDFSGNYKQKSFEVFLAVGSGSVDIKIPDDIGFKVLADIGSGSVAVNNQNIDDNETYKSENYESADHIINFNFNLGSGSIDITS